MWRSYKRLKMSLSFITGSKSSTFDFSNIEIEENDFMQRMDELDISQEAAKQIWECIRIDYSNL